jgi:hypothetical protein
MSRSTGFRCVGIVVDPLRESHPLAERLDDNRGPTLQFEPLPILLAETKRASGEWLTPESTNWFHENRCCRRQIRRAQEAGRKIFEDERGESSREKRTIAMKATSRLFIGCLAILLPVLAAVFHQQRAASQAPESFDTEVHRRPGTTAFGKPAFADATNSGRLRLRVIDSATDRPVFCRVNVVGADGNFYEPADDPLAPWSLHRLGNRLGKGPFRYYGWFFYSNGTSEVSVPPGKTTVEVWKGFEYKPAVAHVEVALGKTAELTISLQRAVDMAARRWYSGDTHIHLDRKDKTDDERALDLAAAEDIQFAHILCMNDPRRYQPLMDQQIWFQNFGLGPKSERRRGHYRIASGQEYRCNTFGHICLIGGSRLVDADGLKTDPNNWPVFGLVADELHGIGGFAFHAHGGYEREIYADFAQRATDGVELLQFAEYRGIGLEGWYHILNAGYRFPAVGASDYPYCRALGDCRTYVYLGDQHLTFSDWNKAAAAGRSFFTTGPLLEVSVNGLLPGDTVRLPKGQHTLEVKVRLLSPVAPVDEIHLIEGGRVREKTKVSQQDQSQPYTWSTRLTIDDSTWVAVRAFASSGKGREDVEAHTNPVYVSIDGGEPYRRESVEWLLKKLDEQIAMQSARQFAERDKVLAYYQKSREVLAGMLTREP